MKINIAGNDKAKILMALFDNAKKSKWTEDAIGNGMCPDSFVRNMANFRDFYQSQINAEIKQLALTEEQAREQLSHGSYINYIGSVLINIDFSSDCIDVTSYDNHHHTNGGCHRAKEALLKQFNVTISNDFLSPSNLNPSTFNRNPSYSMPPKVDNSRASIDSSKALKESIQQSFRTILNPSCQFNSSSYLGLSIELPKGISLIDINKYTELFTQLGIGISYQPETVVVGIHTINAKFNIENETLESLNTKITALQSKVISSSNSSEENEILSKIESSSSSSSYTV